MGMVISASHAHSKSFKPAFVLLAAVKKNAKKELNTLKKS